MRREFDDLPVSVAEIAEVIGLEKTIALIGHLPRSGSRPWRQCLYVPKNLPVDHFLVQVIGWRDAVRLHRAFTGMILQPSNVKFFQRNLRNDRILELHALGASVDEIAAEFRLSRDWVSEILEQSEPERLAAE